MPLELMTGRYNPSVIRRTISHRIVTAAFLVPLVIRSTSAQSSLTLDRTNVAPGSMVTLRWNVPDATEVYVSTLGLLPSIGQRELVAMDTRAYVLVAESNGRMVVSSVDLVVRGSRDIRDVRDLTSFRYPQQVTVPGVSIPRVAACVQSVLERSFDLTGTPFIVGDTLIFVTNAVDAPTLMKKDETWIGMRRVAFQVSVSRQGSATILSVAARVEYHRRAERQWHIDSDDTVHTRSVTNMRQQLMACISKAKDVR